MCVQCNQHSIQGQKEMLDGQTVLQFFLHCRQFLKADVPLRCKVRCKKFKIHFQSLCFIQF